MIQLEGEAAAALRRRRELRRRTDLELCVSGADCRFLIKNSDRPIWREQLQEVIDEWRSRQSARRAGVGLCRCHVPGDTPLTARALDSSGSGHVLRLARGFRGWSPMSRNQHFIRHLLNFIRHLLKRLGN